MNRRIEPRPFWQDSGPLRSYGGADVELERLTKRQRVKRKLQIPEKQLDFRESLEVDGQGNLHDPQYMANMRASNSGLDNRRPSIAEISDSSDEESESEIPTATPTKKSSNGNLRAPAASNNAARRSPSPMNPQRQSALAARSYAGSLPGSVRPSTSRVMVEEVDVSPVTAVSDAYNPYSWNPAAAVNSYRISSAPLNKYSSIPVGAPARRGASVAAASPRTVSSIHADRATISSKASSLRSKQATANSLYAGPAEPSIWEEATTDTTPYKIDSTYIPSLNNPSRHRYAASSQSSKDSQGSLGDSIQRGWEKTKLDLRLSAFRGLKKLRGDA